MRRGVLRSTIVVAALLACHGEREAPLAPVVGVAPPPATAAAPVETVTIPPSDAAAAPRAPSPDDTLDTSAPSSPAALLARAVSPSEISLSWQAASDDVEVIGYEVLRSGVVLARRSSVETTDNSVRPGHRYCYSVVALDGAGNRSPPSLASCASTPDIVRPTAPGDVAVKPTSDRAVAISWSASTDDDGVASYEVFRGDVRVAVTVALQAAESPLQPAGRYCYSVEAVDRAGNRSPRSAPVCATTPDLTPPSAPPGVVVRPWGEHEITVGWNPADDDVGVAGYELLRDGKIVAKGAETNGSEGGLESWREYCYTVRAFDAAGNMSPPSKPSCARTHDLTPPTVPVAVATAVSDKEIAIRWNASADNVAIAGYELQRNKRTVARSTRLEVSEKDLRPAREYCYWIRATDPAGNKSEWSQACATTPDLSPPSTPGNLAIAPRAATQVAAAWEPSQDDVGVVAYEIMRGEEVVATVSKTWTVVPNLAAEKEHCFAVRALDAAGNRSPVTGPRCATTPDGATPPGPVNLRAEAVATGVQLRWDPPPQTGMLYALYRDGDRRVGMTRVEKFTVTGTLFGQRHCYQVAAVDAAGRESPKSLPACAAAGVAVTER